MSRTYIPKLLRRLVKERAGGRCEYYLIPVEFSFMVYYHIDHVIAEQHDGPTSENNLAYACPKCNQFKGSNLGTLLPGSTDIVPLYHPREDNWSDHFQLGESGVLHPLTDAGRATIRLLDLNATDSVIMRKDLLDLSIRLSF